MDVWVGKDTNHKPIIKFNYSKLHIGALALCAPQPPASGAVIYASKKLYKPYKLRNVIEYLEANYK